MTHILELASLASDKAYEHRVQMENWLRLEALINGLIVSPDQSFTEQAIAKFVRDKPELKKSLDKLITKKVS